MAAKMGKVGPFNGDTEEWERLGFFSQPTRSQRVMRRTILLTAYGEPTYKLIRNLVSPRKTEEVPYDVIVGIP